MNDEQTVTVPGSTMRKALSGCTLSITIRVKAKIPLDLRLRLWLVRLLFRMVCVVSPTQVEMIEEPNGE